MSPRKKKNVTEEQLNSSVPVVNEVIIDEVKTEKSVHHHIVITNTMLNGNSASELIISNIYGTLADINENSGDYKILDKTSVSKEFVDIFDSIANVCDTVFRNKNVEYSTGISRLYYTYKMFKISDLFSRLYTLALNEFDFNISTIEVTIENVDRLSNVDRDFIRDYLQSIFKVNL